MTTLLERMRNAEKEATEPKPETDTSGAMRVEVSGMGGPERPSNLVDLMRQWNKNAPKETTEQQTTTKPSKQKLTQAPSEDWKIKPEKQAELDKGRVFALQQELAREQENLAIAKTAREKQIAQTNVDAIRRELVSAGFKGNIGAPKGRSEIDMVNPDRADTISVAPTRPQQSNELVSPANKALRTTAGALDTIIGGIQSFPGALTAETGYAGAKALEGLGLVKPGVAERGREEMYKRFVEPFSKPVGETLGVTQTPEYKGEASQQAMQFVSQNMDKGADWISAKTGIPKPMVENMIFTLSSAVGPAAAAKGKAGLRGAEKFVRGEPSAVPTKRIEPGFGQPTNVQPAVGEVLQQGRVPANEPLLRNVGAAEVNKETQRISKAKELPFPIELSKDQATRNPADVRFARETAKDPVLGQALQEKYANDNAQIQKNLDHFVEQTRAEFTGVGPGDLGDKLVKSIEPYKQERKQKIGEAYDAARISGEMSEKIPSQELANFVKENYSASKNAPIISSINSEIKRLSKNGEISLNDLEEVRKMVGVLSQDSKSNAHYGKEAIKIIDKLTEGKGGDLYKDARRLNTEYMNEFENTPVVKNLFSTKPGTNQRTIAIEDVVDKSLMKGSLADVEALFNTLDKTPQGKVMINEMRGYVAQKIKDEATKGVQLDINGLPYVSTKNLDTIIKNLDKSGKLEFLFGKQGAEGYRTLNDVTKDVQTIPQGTTNPSGTASTVLAALGEMGIQSAVTGVPAPVLTVGKHIYGKVQTKKKLNKINEFINYGKDK
jgi:hypothetical protein